jgi:hypothetical protein
MTETEELQIIAEQNLDSPFILGRIVLRLRRNDAFVQRNKDSRSFECSGEIRESIGDVPFFLSVKARMLSCR